MRSPILLVLFFSAAITLAIAHISALHFYLYWLFPWLDFPVHILGGIVLGLLVFLFPLFHIRLPERYYTLPAVFAFVLIVGLLWELFEIHLGIPLIQGDFELDLFEDLSMDLVGGWVGYLVGKRVSEL